MKKRIALSAVVALFAGLLAAAPATATANETDYTSGGNVAWAGSSTAGVSNYVNATITDTNTAVLGARVVVTGSTIQSYKDGTASSATAAAAGLTEYTFTETSTVLKLATTVAGEVKLSIYWATATGVFSTTATTASLTVTEPASTTASATYSSVTQPTTLTGSATVGTTSDTYTIVVKSTDNAALSGTGVDVRAVVTGPGTATLSNTDTATTGGTTGRDITVEDITNETLTMTVNSDGTSGKATVAIYVGTVLIKTTTAFVFFADLAKLTATKISGIAQAGSTTADYAVLLAGVDASGNAVDIHGKTVSAITSSNTAAFTSATSATCQTASAFDADYEDTDLVCKSSAAAATAANGATADLTFTIKNTAGTSIVSNAVSFAVGGAATSFKLALDKASYVPGEKATVTITAVDVDGKPAYDQTLTGFFADYFVSNMSSTTANIGDSTTVSFADGKATFKVYAPATAGAWTLTSKFGASIPGTQDGTAISLTATVATPVDAAAAAAATANAAAIATLNTAVATLQTTVASLVASMTAQIKVINAALVKIAKKLKVKI